MSIISSIPVLLGDHGAELRAEDDGLLLRRPHEEVRIPLAAVAHVHANGRMVAVELTAPAGTEAALYRIEGVSRAAATVFGEALNGSLPERPAGADPVDGSTLVTVTPREGADAGREADREEEGEENAEPAEPTEPADVLIRCATAAAGLGLLALAAGVVIAGDHVSRALAVLLLGATTVATCHWTLRTSAKHWNAWYLPRHGITVEAGPVLVRGQMAYGYTATDGRARPAPTTVATPAIGGAPAYTYRVAYHPAYPARVVFWGVGTNFGWLIAPVILVTLTALLGWATLALALPAFR
ncbi:hypothetical protein M8Z33_33585 [Streptomyces sp. ZAF1911]|uniref:hypothetical protein n=1 Tax=Streptomyces sp. ZAF1911 TaxID=2944129 RepID=UPI00237AFDF1|nr:hypothetical protein [Streptomyces sp. ZAF1911]MDD9381497.1 hypothetical protein [Streptomyces sp. ZAF1911]